MLLRSNFSSFPQYFACYLFLDFHVKTGTIFSLRDKRLFEISEVEITRVDCIVFCCLFVCFLLLFFCLVVVFWSLYFILFLFFFFFFFFFFFRFCFFTNMSSGCFKCENKKKSVGV